MWTMSQPPEPIEKIRKAQWTVEQTRATRAVVIRLQDAELALRATGQEKSEVARAIQAGILRLMELDPKVEK